MKTPFLHKTLLTVGMVASSVMMAASNAQAFTFTTNYSGTPPKGDVFLDSIQVGSKLISQFALVNKVENFTNDVWTGGNTGGASSDKGDEASGIAVENPTDSDIVASLGNLNLNNIVDTEDNGSFSMDVSFDKAFNSLLFWERGINSTIGVRINGITKTITAADFAKGDTGLTIDTTEVNSAQKVGSYGLKLSDFGITGQYTGPVTLFSRSAFKGPDFKVVGATVPEPATVLGLTAVAGALVASRRRKSADA